MEKSRKSVGFRLTKEAAKHHGAKGGRTPPHKFLIEKEYVTYVDIAARLRVSVDVASRRMRKLLADGQTPTWELLGLQI